MRRKTSRRTKEYLLSRTDVGIHIYKSHWFGWVADNGSWFIVSNKDSYLQVIEAVKAEIKEAIYD